MSPTDMIRRDLKSHAISFGVKEADSYRISDPLVLRFERGQYIRLSDLFDAAKKESKRIVKGYK